MDPTGTTSLSFLSGLRDPGNARSWAEFHKRYGELMYSYARRLGASHDEAEDILQEVEMYVFKAMDGFRHQARKGCFRAYLRTAVLHAMGRRAGKKSHRETLIDPHTVEVLAQEHNPPDAVWEREQYLDRVRRAVRSIAKEFEPVTLEAFRLHVLAGRSVAETAEHLGLSKDSVYQAKSRILRRLRERISLLNSDVDT
jgi:RNA polymerase sigma-70 factor (ECF subfamily)